MSHVDLPETLHLRDPADLALAELLLDIHAGESVPAAIRRRFEDEASGWRLSVDELAWARSTLDVRLDRLKRRLAVLDDAMGAFRDPEVREHVHAALLILRQASEAYALQQGISRIAARAKGGRSREEPDWWEPTRRQYKLLVAMGHDPEEIIEDLAKSAVADGHSKSAIRRMLQKKGDLKKRVRTKRVK